MCTVSPLLCVSRLLQFNILSLIQLVSNLSIHFHLPLSQAGFFSQGTDCAVLNTKLSSSSLPDSEAAAPAMFYAWHVIPGLLHLLTESSMERMGWDTGMGVGLGHPGPCSALETLRGSQEPARS